MDGCFTLKRNKCANDIPEPYNVAAVGSLWGKKEEVARFEEQEQEQEDCVSY
jgi:hypothetical protein